MNKSKKTQLEEVLNFFILNNITDKRSLDEILTYCDELLFKDEKCRGYDLFKDYGCVKTRQKRQTRNTTISNITTTPSPDYRDIINNDIFGTTKLPDYSDINNDIFETPDFEDITDNVSYNNTGNTTIDTLKKTHGSSRQVKIITFSILYMPQFILAMVLVLNVKSRASWRVLLEQPSLVLMAVFTYFTCSRINSGCGGQSDDRLKIDKVFTIINMVVSNVSYILVFIIAHVLLDSDDWGWAFSGFHSSILAQLLVFTLPFIILGNIFTINFLYFCQSSCSDTCDCPDEEIVVYNPEDIDQHLVFENGEVQVKNATGVQEIEMTEK